MSPRRSRTLCALAGLMLIAGSAVAVAPPTISAKAVKPVQAPYDEKADAHAQVAKAIADAKANHKYVLLDFGGNWCPDCRVLAGVLSAPEVQGAVQSTFSVAMIDVGRFNKNMDIPKGYGVKVDGVPAVIILDPDGHFLNSGNPTALANAREMTPQAIVDTVFGWTAPAH